LGKGNFIAGLSVPGKDLLYIAYIENKSGDNNPQETDDEAGTHYTARPQVAFLIQSHQPTAEQNGG
jgi:hypothetical protein